ncbi:PP2C family serine/threonine-protein phosphatase [Crocosphaera sp. Alani8]|uniref:PP2C family serine/threonine-protein phosphatase n=1 Tax=Crocosphaera sp. Alani8 TaxID=3038952 RepID=UPI00313CF607
MSWKASSYSSIGVQHQKLQTPCQDYADYYFVKNEIIIGAVADGAGSAKMSHEGAKLAVTKAIEYLTGYVDNYQENYPEHPINFEQDQLLTTIVDDLKHKAELEDYLLKDLACTLIAFIATPKWVTAMQIGDGFLVIREKEKEDYQLVFEPNKGEYVNETTFVTSDNAMNQMQVEVIKGYYPFICAASDGLEKVAIRQKDYLAFPPFFKPLEEYLITTENPEKENSYLINFLDSERLNARTHDDKTLLLCLHQESHQ